MTEDEPGARLFMAEAAYAQSIVPSALGDLDACIASLEQSLENVPTYAPAILALGSIDYSSTIWSRAAGDCSRCSTWPTTNGLRERRTSPTSWTMPVTS